MYLQIPSAAVGLFIRRRRVFLYLLTFPNVTRFQIDKVVFTAFLTGKMPIPLFYAKSERLLTLCFHLGNLHFETLRLEFVPALLEEKCHRVSRFV